MILRLITSFGQVTMTGERETSGKQSAPSRGIGNKMASTGRSDSRLEVEAASTMRDCSPNFNRFENDYEDSHQ